MADNSSLLKQLASRARNLHDQTGVSQAQMARAIGTADGNYSNFLAGKRGIGAEATCLLLKYTNMPKQQAIAAFSKPLPTSKITLLQEQGRRMRFDNSGWYPGTGTSGAGQDPNDAGNSIDDTPDDDTGVTVEATVATLRQVRSIHRKIIKSINAFIANADVRAKVNRDGPTGVNINQRFNASRILHCVGFSKNADRTDAVQALVDALNTLNDGDRREVLSAIINGR
jgi:hypothetical protein